jgi:hypothetical protein
MCGFFWINKGFLRQGGNKHIGGYRGLSALRYTAGTARRFFCQIFKHHKNDSKFSLIKKHGKKQRL